MSRQEHQPPDNGETLLEVVQRRTGRNPAACYQCGKCSAGCPMAEETSLRPHDVMRLILRDDREGLFAGESIWICLTCETCTARCPNDCDPARVMDALRELEPASASLRIRAFHQAFLDQVKSHGRLFEVGLVIQYKLRTGTLLQDVAAIPGMFRRGKLNLLPHRTRDVADVRRIFSACTAAAEEEPESWGR
jgi:heterodisulfide reductase subunit C